MFSTFKGIVVPAEELELSFPISGLLAEMLVREGDTVRAGDVLARLDTTLLDTEVSIAGARLASAQAALAKVLTGASPEEIAEAEYTIQSINASFYASAAAQAADRAAAQARLDYLRSLPRPEDVAIAQAAVDEMQSVYDAAAARRAQAWLVAPVDGTVLSLRARQYEYVGAGETVLTIADLSQLRIRTVEIVEGDIARLKPGDPAALTFPALPGVEIEGVIESIAAEIDARGTSTFVVLIALPEVPPGLRRGMTAYIDIRSP
ncbi:MAG: hypothetical protein Kow00124_09190 [Anaerolineae bacterium]